MANILSCPTCAAVIVPQEAGEVCPKCRTPLPQSQIETVMPQDLPGADDATRLATGTGSAASRTSSSPHDRGARALPADTLAWYRALLALRDLLAAK